MNEQKLYQQVFIQKKREGSQIRCYSVCGTEIGLAFGLMRAFGPLLKLEGCYSGAVLFGGILALIVLQNQALKRLVREPRRNWWQELNQQIVIKSEFLEGC